MSPPIGAARSVMTAATGSELTVIDQFDAKADYDHQNGAGDVTETTNTTHDADLPSWVDDNVFEAVSPNFTELADTGAGSVDALPSKGDSEPSELYISADTSTHQHGPLYNVIDGGNYYGIEVDGSGSQVAFFKRENGSRTDYQTWSVTAPGADLVRVTWQHGDGTNGLADEEHKVLVENVSQGTTLVDTTWTIGDGGETPLTVSDGFGVYFNTSGTMRAHGAAISGQPTSSNGGGGGGGTYYTGDTLYTSNYTNAQDAINAATATDIVVFDQTESVADISPASLTVDKADIKLYGDPGVSGNHIEASSTNPTGDMLRIEEPAQNIWVDNLTIDCRCDFATGGGAPGAARGIGGLDIGELDHIRLTNNTINNAGRNGISFVNGDDDGSGATGDLTDFYIANNDIIQADGHGILMGIWGQTGPMTIQDVIYEGNTVQWTNSQALGCFVVQDSAGSHVGDSVLYLDNLVDQRSGSGDPTPGDSGSNCSLEANIDRSAYYGNEVYATSGSTQGGPSTTKGGEEVIIARNYVEDGGRMTRVMDRPAGVGDPPLTTFVHANECTGGNHVCYLEDTGDYQVSDNKGTAGITENGTLTGTTTVFNNNSSPGVPTGIPSSFDNPASFTDSQGDTVGALSWDIGGPDPANPVSVAVDVNLSGGASV
jgi:hypothetical protein